MNGQKKLRASVSTLGCRVNFYESRAMEEELARLGAEICSPEEKCDLCIVNSCTVTAESDRKSRQLTRRLRDNSPGAVIVVTGCASQNDPDAFRRIEGVDAVFGNRNKLDAVRTGMRLAQERAEGQKPSDCITDIRELRLSPIEPMEIHGFDRTRAYLKIEDGCSRRCAYCTIPFVRGPVCSKPVDDVIREVKELAAAGCTEVVFTGIETSEYDGLEKLLEEADRVEGIRRIRLGSLEPSFADKRFTEFYASLEHTAPHLHLSVQSGSSRILRAMRRGYDRDTLLRNISDARKAIPSLQLSADVICGFPGETEEDFKDSCSLAREADFLHMHIFPYSRRKGTAADGMPDQIPSSEAERRCAVLSEINKELKKNNLDRIISEKRDGEEILFETVKSGKDGKRYAVGHSSSFVLFKAGIGSECPDDLRGRYGKVLPLSQDGESITGKLI